MKCMVRCCRNNRRHLRGKSFFRFPKDRSLCQQWLEGIGCNNFNIKEGSNVCEDHFSQGSILEGKFRKSLRLGAVPKHLFVDCEKCSTHQSSIQGRLQSNEEERNEQDIPPVITPEVLSKTSLANSYCLEKDNNNTNKSKGHITRFPPYEEEIASPENDVALPSPTITPKFKSESSGSSSNQYAEVSGYLQLMITEEHRYATGSNTNVELDESDRTGNECRSPIEYSLTEQKSQSLTIVDCMETSDEDDCSYSAIKYERRHEKLKKLRECLIKKNKIIKNLQQNARNDRRKITKLSALLNDMKSNLKFYSRKTSRM